MKNSTLIPVFSLSVAAAFGLGWVMHPAPEAEASSSTEPEDSARNNPGTKSKSPSSLGPISAGRLLAGRPEAAFVARYAVNGSISGEDMASALKEIANTNDPLLKQKMFASLLENLTVDNARDAFLALRDNAGGPFGGNNDELRLLAHAWGRLDGPGAVAALKEIEAEQGEGGGGRGWRGRGPGPLSGILAGWASVDGEAAGAYVAGIEDEGEQRGAAFGVIQGMLVNGVDEAMGFISSLPTSEEGNRARGMYMAMVTGEMLEQGLDQAQGWVDTVKDPELRAGAIGRVAMEMIGKDRAGAADWIAKYGDDEAASWAVNRLADNWSNEDPQAVLSWADQLSGENKAQAYQETMQNWARQDAVAAGEYLKTLSNSPERDAAVEGYATRVAEQDPIGAMAWAESIADADMRQGAVVDVARDWYRQDRAAAEQWIQASGLGEEAVKSITEPRRDRPWDRR